MTKKQLCTNDIIMTSKGLYGIVLLKTGMGDYIHWFIDNNGNVISKIDKFDAINDALLFVNKGLDYRITRVYRCTDSYTLSKEETIQDKYLLWEEQIAEVTMDELERIYGHKVKIIEE